VQPSPQFSAVPEAIFSLAEIIGAQALPDLNHARSWFRL